jgi:hypothetical protein
MLFLSLFIGMCVADTEAAFWAASGISSAPRAAALRGGRVGVDDTDTAARGGRVGMDGARVQPPMTLLGGFLGAGKTTTLTHLRTRIARACESPCSSTMWPP